ncbi:MAG TPA: PIN domain-containing protein [Candidatus Acidoferrales bacterium]|jgi:PIN domain nuclease of toxin-antitoxin system|nr:PIN domain-containing protein [Candidatus Acidoferrales bacterium]
MGQQVISYLDTNVVIFLHSGNAARLSRRAIEQIESTDLLVSAMVMLELEMLYEKGTINYPASQILADLNQQIGVSVCQLPMAAIMNRAVQVKWTREPGDRIIVANAIANNEVPLVTSDRRIHEQYPNAIW